MTRVLHTGDTHLGYQQYHVRQRRADFLAAFRQVATDAVEQDVDAVVHAGDLFHDRRPSLSDIMGAIDVLRTLADAAIPFLAVVGNHEGKRRAQWLDLFEDLGLATRLGADPVTVGDLAVYGLDFVPRAKRDSLSMSFATHDGGSAALVTHGLFEPFPHGEWDLHDLLARTDVTFDAILLGDDHTPQTRWLAEPYETVATYCGSTERVSATERDERGYNLVHFDSEVDVRRRGLETRRFVYVDVELAEQEGTARVQERILEEELAEAVVIVTVTGDGEPVTPAAIEEAAADEGALVTRVSDQRELGEAAKPDVAFADPDQIVHDRIRELGLSEAARDIDETIRADDVADSSVADAVEDRVRGLIQEADRTVFDPGPGPDADDSTEQQTTDDPATDRSPIDDQVTMEEYL